MTPLFGGDFPFFFGFDRVSVFCFFIGAFFCSFPPREANIFHFPQISIMPMEKKKRKLPSFLHCGADDSTGGNRRDWPIPIVVVETRQIMHTQSSSVVFDMDVRSEQGIRVEFTT